MSEKFCEHESGGGGCLEEQEKTGSQYYIT